MLFKEIKNHSCLLVNISGVVLLFVLLIVGCSGVKVTTYYENGALATAAPIATDIGASIFARGGNAFDAAVAVGFALAVVHPEAGNIGGGGFAVIRDGKTGTVKALDFREVAPEAAYEKMFLDEQDEVVEELSTVGAKAAGVPGTVAGLYELWDNYGSMSWEDLVGYAAALADTGFIVDNYLAESFRDYRDDLSEFPYTKNLFYPNERAYNAGDKIIQSDLAQTLYRIAAQGKDGFYSGETADSMEQTMLAYDGLITKKDLEDYQVSWREPLHFKFDSLDIYSMSPPSSGGIVMGQILKMLEPFDFSNYYPEDPAYIHLFCEASRLNFADRSEHLGDPDFYRVPINTLMDENYINQRASFIDPKRMTPLEEIKPGIVPGHESDQTTHFSIADKDGNLVSITYTLNTSYGSKLAVNGCGFLLNNEMDDFSIKPGVPNTYGLVGGQANSIEPKKRMLSSMSPTIVLKNNQPFLVLGSPGGSKIITVITQAVLNFTRFNLGPQETVAQARFHHQWIPDILYLEEGGFSEETKRALEDYGYTVQYREKYSDLQLLYIESGGLITGASDPRNRGKVAGF